MSHDSRNGGFSLVEALVALLVGLLVVHLALTSFARMRSLHSNLTSRAEFIGSVRLLRHVVRGELRNALVGRDAVVAADSISLRAFRGTAIVCRRESPTEHSVSFRGHRMPNASKDSVLTIGPLGQTAVAGLLSSRPVVGRCQGGVGGSQEAWQLDREIDGDAVVIRLFERGSYHLVRSALRYRSGRGGRQPLTPEVLATPGSGWTRVGGVVWVELTPLDTTMAPSWRGYLGAALSP